MKFNFLKKKKKFIKGGSKIKPDFYWRYIVYLTFVLFFLSCIFGIFLFKKVNSEITLSVENSREQETIKKERFNEILEYFQEREKKSIEIINSPSPISDPSI